MNRRNETLRVIFSGGGTGGHIFPAVAIADKVKEMEPDAEIRFVGALGRMEMERVPKAGYPIEGLWISGIQRKLSLQNLLFPFKLLSSLWGARKIVRQFKPHVVVGTGGFASGPLLRQAAAQGFPTLIQEQNAYAGLTNKWLAGVADCICVAYPGMERYFPAEKIQEAGNPVREDLLQNTDVKAAACAHYGFDAERPLIMIMGGSLGARTLNEALAAATDLLKRQSDVQVLWQCGKLYVEQYKNCATAQLPNVKMQAFLDRMEYAYAAADLVISRAGALSIAEICLLGKPAILVPSPNVAEDHQTKNANALAAQSAAKVVKDSEAKTSLMQQALQVLADKKQLQTLSVNARKMAYPAATETIAREVLGLAGWEVPQPTSTTEIKLDNIKQIYFVGIGGIGMSAIARYFNSRGVEVAGYDRTETTLTQHLVAEGITVRYEEEVASLPANIDLVVYTPAIPDSHTELKWFREQGYPVYKRSQVLGVISEGMRTVAIAGTHGKTTTSTLTTHLLRSGGVDCNAFLGGVARNFSSNFVEGSSDWVVIEADEFDRSFLTLHPDIATIMSMDADHLDIYGDEESMLETGFLAFVKQLKAGGTLLVRAGLKHHFKEIAQLKSFGIETGDIQAKNLRVAEGYFVFDYVSETMTIERLQHPHPGRHNVENALAAITVALNLGATAEQIKSGLLSFRGIGRRFEFHIREADRAYIDDYAHHPTELEAAIGAARELYPDKK
ncbi:MAG: undecaprenyldiphospho-muramoylpentapeptide beta-N-acetylglucosaminyltransferase, partial [Bacteroidota bacterium]